MLMAVSLSEDSWKSLASNMMRAELVRRDLS